MSATCTDNSIPKEGLLYIGWGQADATPTGSIRLAGQFHQRVSTHVHSPLITTALAMETKDENGHSIDQAVWVSCDLVGIYEGFTRQVREEMQKRLPDLCSDKISINATHTHTAPVMPIIDDPLTNADITPFIPEHLRNEDKETSKSAAEVSETQYWDFLKKKVCQAIIQAWQGLQRGAVSHCLGHAVVGFNRRVTYDDGSALMYGNSNTPNYFAPEGPEDHGVELLYTWDDEDQLTGAVVNVICPSQVVEMKEFVSSDYWGELRRQLPERMEKPIFILPMCGAAGDISPRDMVRAGRGEPNMHEVEGAVELGRRVLDAVIENIPAAQEDKKDRLILAHKVCRIPLAVRTVSETDKNKAQKEFDAILASVPAGQRLSIRNVVALYNPGGVLERYEAQKKRTLFYAEVHAIRLGDVAFTTNPFELFITYGLQIKARSRAEQTFISQLTNHRGMYLPTQKAIDGGHYSAYLGSGVCGAQGGKQLVEGTIELVNSMWPMDE